MPELPEVERARRLAEEVLAGRTLDEVHSAADDIVYDGCAPEEVEEALRGARVDSVHRRGKYLWLALDRRPWPLFHFGMTGGFRVPGRTPLKLASSRSEEDGAEWPPRYTKIRLVTGDGGELAMTNSRRLGRIRLRDDPASEPPVENLGFDPLLDLPDPETFRSLVSGRRAVIKGLLLNQGFAAGVGNWIADEVLYQARIDPRRRASNLSEDEIDALREALRRVVGRAVEVNAEKDRFPDDWLFHRRWGKGEGVEDADGNPVEFEEIGGRTTAWVPKRQS